MSTRFACLLSKIARRAPGRCVPVDLEGLAQSLGCTRDYLRKLMRRYRTRGWFFQTKHAAVYLTHEKSPECPRGRWQFWVVERHTLTKIHAAPGRWRRLRAHCRQGSSAAWADYLMWLAALAFNLLSKNRRHGTHKGFPHGIKGATAKRGPPPTANRAAQARFIGLAASVQADYDQFPGRPTVNLYGWAMNRFSEGHDRATCCGRYGSQ